MLAWFIYSTSGRDFLPFSSTCFRKENSQVVAFSMSFLRVPLFTQISYYLLLYLGFCKAYQNCLVALIKITTADVFTVVF